MTHSLPVIDTHAHVVGKDVGTYPLRHRDDGLHTDWIDLHALDAAEFDRLATSSGIGRYLLVQALSAHDFDNTYVIDSAAWCGAGAIVGVDVTSESAVADLDKIADRDAVAGVRIFDMGTGSLDNAVAYDVAARCAAAGLPVSVMTVEAGLARARKLAAAVPEARIVIDHAGLPDLIERDGIPDSLAWVPGMENVALKLTTYNFGGPPEQVAELIERCRRLVGAERLMWGSDFPHSFDPPYAGQVRAVVEGCRHLGDHDRNAILRGTALRHYPRLSEPRPPAESTSR